MLVKGIITVILKKDSVVHREWDYFSVSQRKVPLFTHNNKEVHQPRRNPIYKGHFQKRGGGGQYGLFSYTHLKNSHAEIKFSSIL